MPIELTFRRKVVLSDIWCDKATWDEVFANDLPALIEFLVEDPSEVLDECGGLAGLIESATWKETAERAETSEEASA